MTQESQHTDSRATMLQKATRSVKWAFLGSLAPRLITPFTSMLLAALLTPDDFGIIAITNMVVMLARILVESGMGMAIIQRKEYVEEAASVAFGFSIFAGTIIYLLLWLFAPTLEILYELPNLGTIIRTASLSLIVLAFTAAPTAMMQRQMEFRKLFWVTGLPQIVTALTSVIWAFLGGGVWALVWGPLLGNVVNALVVWHFTTWRPRLVTDLRLLLSLLRFSVWIMLSSFQFWLFSYFDNAIAGLYFNSQELGYYALGFNLSSMLPSLLTAALMQVAYPAFCNLQDNPADVGRALVSLQRVLAVIVFPVGFGLAAVALPAIQLLYGEKWLGMGQVMMIFAILPGLTHFWSLSGEAYRAINRPDIWTKLTAVMIAAMMPLLFLTGPYGLMIYVLARAGVSILVPLLNIFWGGRFLDLTPRRQLEALARPFGAALLMFIGITGFMQIIAPFAGLAGWLKLLALITGGVLFYIGLIWFFARSLFYDFIDTVRRVLEIERPLTIASE